MVWKEPKTNWSTSDAVTNDDLNRIEGNTKDLKDNKVDKVVGKGLSSADFTQAEKDKLAGIASGANKYIHPSTHPASMITGLPTSLPANGGNADTVDGKHATDFVNAVASGSTSDPNTTQLPYILTNHANSPGLGKYWHIQTLFYSSKTGNRAQIAVDYNHTGGYMYIRHYYGGSWTSWKKVWTQDTDGSGSGLDAELIKGRDIFDYKLIDLEEFNTIIIEELSTTQITSPSRDVWYSYTNYTVTKTGLTRKISVNPTFYGWNSSGDQYGSHDIQILRNGVIIFETTFSKVYTASIIDDIASFSEGANITYAFKQKVTSSGVAKIGIRRKLYTNTIYNRRLV